MLGIGCCQLVERNVRSRAVRPLDQRCSHLEAGSERQLGRVGVGSASLLCVCEIVYGIAPAHVRVFCIQPSEKVGGNYTHNLTPAFVDTYPLITSQLLCARLRRDGCRYASVAREGLVRCWRTEHLGKRIANVLAYARPLLLSSLTSSPLPSLSSSPKLKYPRNKHDCSSERWLSQRK